MPICIECRYPVKTLYTEYSKADDRALGKGVRLTQCPRCRRFADKYVEHDFVVLFIDLVLIKPQVYRHLLFNRLGRDDGRFDRSIVRLGILLLLFDVYLTWARIEKLPLPASHTLPSDSDNQPPTNAMRLQAQPLMLQYLFFLVLVGSSTVAFHAPIRFLCSLKPSSQGSRSPPAAEKVDEAGNGDSDENGHGGMLARLWARLIPYYPHPVPLSTALLVSSCTKLFPILLIIWDYDLPSSATAVSWAVIANNIAALEILMDCGYVRASVLVAVGAVARSAVVNAMLWAAGLGGLGIGEGGSWGFGEGVQSELSAVLGSWAGKG